MMEFTLPVIPKCNGKDSLTALYDCCRRESELNMIATQKEIPTLLSRGIGQSTSDYHDDMEEFRLATNTTELVKLPLHFPFNSLDSSTLKSENIERLNAELLPFPYFTERHLVTHCTSLLEESIPLDDVVSIITTEDTERQETVRNEENQRYELQGKIRYFLSTFSLKELIELSWNAEMLQHKYLLDQEEIQISFDFVSNFFYAHFDGLDSWTLDYFLASISPTLSPIVHSAYLNTECQSISILDEPCNNISTELYQFKALTTQPFRLLSKQDSLSDSHRSRYRWYATPINLPNEFIITITTLRQVLTFKEEVKRIMIEAVIRKACTEIQERSSRFELFRLYVWITPYRLMQLLAIQRWYRAFRKCSFRKYRLEMLRSKLNSINFQSYSTIGSKNFVEKYPSFNQMKSISELPVISFSTLELIVKEILPKNMLICYYREFFYKYQAYFSSVSSSNHEAMRLGEMKHVIFEKSGYLFSQLFQFLDDVSDKIEECLMKQVLSRDSFRWSKYDDSEPPTRGPSFSGGDPRVPSLSLPGDIISTRCISTRNQEKCLNHNVVDVNQLAFSFNDSSGVSDLYLSESEDQNSSFENSIRTLAPSCSVIENDKNYIYDANFLSEIHLFFSEFMTVNNIDSGLLYRTPSHQLFLHASLLSIKTVDIMLENKRANVNFLSSEESRDWKYLIISFRQFQAPLSSRLLWWQDQYWLMATECVQRQFYIRGACCDFLRIYFDMLLEKYTSIHLTTEVCTNLIQNIGKFRQYYSFGESINHFDIFSSWFYIASSSPIQANSEDKIPLVLTENQDYLAPREYISVSDEFSTTVHSTPCLVLSASYLSHCFSITSCFSKAGFLAISPNFKKRNRAIVIFSNSSRDSTPFIPSLSYRLGYEMLQNIKEYRAATLSNSIMTMWSIENYSWRAPWKVVLDSQFPKESLITSKKFRFIQNIRKRSAAALILALFWVASQEAARNPILSLNRYRMKYSANFCDFTTFNTFIDQQTCKIFSNNYFSLQLTMEHREQIEILHAESRTRVIRERLYISQRDRLFDSMMQSMPQKLMPAIPSPFQPDIDFSTPIATLNFFFLGRKNMTAKITKCTIS